MGAVSWARGVPPREHPPRGMALNIHNRLWYTRTPLILLHAQTPLAGLPPPLMDGGPAPFSVEGSLWPLLSVKLGRSATAREFESYLDLRRAWLERREPHVCILDVRAVHLPPHVLRQRYTQWAREHETALSRWVLGTAYVIQSPEVRVIMSLIRHSAQLKNPFVVTETLPPAAAWAAGRLQEAGLAQAAQRTRATHAIAAS